MRSHESWGLLDNCHVQQLSGDAIAPPVGYQFAPLTAWADSLDGDRLKVWVRRISVGTDSYREVIASSIMALTAFLGKQPNKT